MSWVAPDKWKRTIRAAEFSQTLIVDGDKIFEQDLDNYLPLAIQVLTTAMVDPRPIIAAFRPGDIARTKANGASDESGKVCFGKVCVQQGNGLVETVAAPGRSVTFTDYHPFKHKRVARQLFYQIDPGDSYQAHVPSSGSSRATTHNLRSLNLRRKRNRFDAWSWLKLISARLPSNQQKSSGRRCWRTTRQAGRLAITCPSIARGRSARFFR